MTSIARQPENFAAGEPVPFESTEAALRFERRAIAAIRHAAGYGLFTAEEALSMVERVSRVAAETIAALSAGSREVSASRAG